MQHADQVRSYARWRPGWSPGRSGYAWLLPLAEQSGLRTLVNQYQYALRDLPGFDTVALEWMHILVQEIGFIDEVPDSQVESLLDAAQDALAEASPLTLSFHHAVVLPESLALPAEPQAQVTELRSTLRGVTTSVLGAEIPAEPDETDQHVSLAHPNADGPAVFAAATLSGTVVDPTTAQVAAVSLVKLIRDHASSEWETLGRVPFGS
jgi:2'-5' RNA ligase